VNKEPIETPAERSIVLEIITEFIESGELKNALEDIKKEGKLKVRNLSNAPLFLALSEKLMNGNSFLNFYRGPILFSKTKKCQMDLR